MIDVVAVIASSPSEVRYASRMTNRGDSRLLHLERTDIETRWGCRVGSWAIVWGRWKGVMMDLCWDKVGLPSK